MVSPIADFVVDMGSDGRIVSQGTLSNALAHDAKLLKELRHEQEEMEKAKQELDQETPEDENAKQAAGKLIVEEETELPRPLLAGRPTEGKRDKSSGAHPR